MSIEVAPIIAGYDSFSLIRERDDFSIWRARLIENGLTVEIIIANEGAKKSITDRLFGVYGHIKASSHPNLLRVLELNYEAPNPYIVTEHFIGRSLYSTVKDHGPFDSAKVLRLARQIALALTQLNSTRHFVVRNLKPDNIRLDDAGNVKLCDFTLAIFPDERGLGIDAEDEGSVVGTPQYISPEQAAASPDIDFRSDIYSLGAVLYYISTGVIPFDIPDVMKILELQSSGALPDPRTIKHDLPEGFVTLISLLMIKNPNHRIGSWDAVVDNIKNLENGREVIFEPPLGAVSTIHRLQPSGSDKNKTDSSAAKRSFSAAITPPFVVRALLWILLLAWFLWLADARLGSPMKLPGSAELAMLIDRTLQDYKESSSDDIEEEESDDGDAIVPLNPDTRDTTPVVEDKLEEAVNESSSENATKVGENQVEKLEESSKTVATPVQESEKSEVPYWGNKILEQFRKGNIREALRIAETSQSEFGMEVARVISKMPNLDEAVAAQIILQKGKETKIVFMGRTRILIPLNRMSNTVISTSFNDRIVRVDVKQFSPEEKLRWLENVSDEGGNARALALAIQLSDDDAIRRHAARAGAVGKLLGE